MSLHADYSPMMETDSKPQVFVTSESKRFSPGSVRCRFLVIFVAALGIIALTLIILQFVVPKNTNTKTTKLPDVACTGDCTITLVESIPENVAFPKGSIRNPSIYSGWKNLLNMATKEIDIASFYWTLRGDDTSTSDPSTKQGEDVFQSLEAAAERGVKIRIVQSPPSKQFPSLDTIELQKKKLAEVRLLDMTHLVGSGIIHTKMWLVDGQHFYVGSANQDWRALTQIQELGLMTYNCSCLAEDMSKIFEVYWDLALPKSKIPDPWPDKYKTSINADSPAQIKINGSNAAGIYLASAPKQLCPPERADDLSTILRIIDSAKQFVYVSVMDYFPTTLFQENRTYWPVIDDALRRAAFDRKVKVRLVASLWNHTRPDMKFYLQSLAALNGANGASVQVKFYKVPPYSKEIPYTRVNHNKFMVTDSVAYIGTSNWSADYFTGTAGIGYVINETETGNTVRAQLQAVFERNWDSNFTISVNCNQ